MGIHIEYCWYDKLVLRYYKFIYSCVFDGYFIYFGAFNNIHNLNSSLLALISLSTTHMIPPKLFYAGV